MCEHVGLVPEEGRPPLARVVEVEAEGEDGEGGLDGDSIGLGFTNSPKKLPKSFIFKRTYEL